MKILLMASYCDDDGCTDELPCQDCLVMCNVAEIPDETPVSNIMDYSYQRYRLEGDGE